jgi:hypothetical protein
MATKKPAKPVAKKPISAPAKKAVPAKAKPAAKIANPAAKQAAKPVTKVPAKVAAVQPEKQAKTSAAPHAFGWGHALKLWWAVIWRHFGLSVITWLVLGFVASVALGAFQLKLNEENLMFWVFQNILSEYISFVILWLALWLVVRKGQFKWFSIAYFAYHANQPTKNLDSILPLTWSIYWRFLALKIMLIAALYAVVALGTLMVIPGAMLGGNAQILYGMLAMAIALFVAFVLGQIAVFKWLASHTLYKRFSLIITPR